MRSRRRRRSSSLYLFSLVPSLVCVYYIVFHVYYISIRAVEEPRGVVPSRRPLSVALFDSLLFVPPPRFLVAPARHGLPPHDEPRQA